MIKQIVPILAGTLLISVTILGCKGSTGPVGPSGTLSGDLYGQVSLHDADSSRITNNSGVTISIVGTGKSASTDSEGWWRINGLSTGTYTLVFGKPGFATYKQFGFQFVGGDSLFHGSLALGNIARYHVTSISASIGTDSVVHFLGTVSSAGAPPSHNRHVILFIDTSGSVSPTRHSAVLFSFISTSTTFGYNIATSELVNAYGFPSHASLYCVAYGFDTTIGNTYYDPTLRVTIYATISEMSSEVVTVKLP